eukprot:5407613-Alexandrium_andersonii.AAC.1
MGARKEDCGDAQEPAPAVAATTLWSPQRLIWSPSSVARSRGWQSDPVPELCNPKPGLRNPRPEPQSCAG